MTKAEAIHEMSNGKKLSHRHFSPDEYIFMESGKLCTGDGAKVHPDEFWRWRQEPTWMTGWELYQGELKAPEPIIFNEKALRHAIAAEWGPAGAHIEVFDKMALRIKELEADVVIEKLKVKLNYQTILSLEKATGIRELIKLAFKKGESWGVTYSTWFTPSEEDTNEKMKAAQDELLPAEAPSENDSKDKKLIAKKDGN